MNANEWWRQFIVQHCWGKRIPLGHTFNEGVMLDIMLSKQRRQEESGKGK